MISESLEYVLESYADVEDDISELSKILTRNKIPEWLESFHDELTRAIQDGSLTPRIADRVMAREFDDQAALDRWLHEAWAEWFPGEPYPS